MGKRITYKKGDKLGPYNIEFVKEVEPKEYPSGRKDRYAIFICPFCQKEFSAAIPHIKSGHTKSCGCYNDKIRIQNGCKTKRNLEGQRFGKLTVIEDSGKRNGSNVIWKCKCDCGNIVYRIGNDLCRGRSTHCGCSKIRSKGEMKIKNFLDVHHIEYDQEYILPNKLRFDFFLKNNSIAIEYDGEQHFKAVGIWGGEKAFQHRQECDNIKNQYCKENNIKLIRIPYTEYDNIETILDKELLQLTEAK